MVEEPIQKRQPQSGARLGMPLCVKSGLRPSFCDFFDFVASGLPKPVPPSGVSQARENAPAEAGGHAREKPLVGFLPACHEVEKVAGEA